MTVKAFRGLGILRLCLASLEGHLWKPGGREIMNEFWWFKKRTEQNSKPWTPSEGENQSDKANE